MGEIIINLSFGLFSLLAIVVSAWQLKYFFPEENPFRNLLPCMYFLLGVCFIVILLSIIL